MHFLLYFLSALLSTATTTTSDGSGSHHHHHSNTSTNGHFNRAQIVLIEHSLAQKRVRVVQLLVVGVVGIVFGGLGNFFVSDSCHFLSIPAPSSSSSTTANDAQNDSANNNNADGDNSMTTSPFVLHFGIWKYSPIESSAMGYPYCIQYGDPYPEPIASRFANSLALLCAVLSMIILWWYLIVGIPVSWSTGVYAAAAAGIFQLLTPILFVQSRLCRRAAYGQCQTGPSVILSCFVGVLWLIVAAELHYNAPLSLKEEVQLRLHQQQQQQRRTPIAPTSLELADFKDASLQFWHRFYRPPTPLTTATDRCRLK
jgi:hypothetical protein